MQQDELRIAWIAGFPIGDIQSFDEQRSICNLGRTCGVIMKFHRIPFAVKPGGARPLFRLMVLRTPCWMWHRP